MNKTLWIGIGFLVATVVVAGYLLYGKGTYPPSQNTGGYTARPLKEFTVVAKEYGLTPSKISVNKGGRVVINFKNAGRLSHNLTIPDLSLVTNTVAAGQSDKLDFVASQAGTFTFYCSVDGHKDLGMQGSLTVQ